MRILVMSLICLTTCGFALQQSLSLGYWQDIPLRQSLIFPLGAGLVCCLYIVLESLLGLKDKKQRMQKTIAQDEKMSLLKTRCDELSNQLNSLKLQQKKSETRLAAQNNDRKTIEKEAEDLRLANQDLKVRLEKEKQKKRQDGSGEPYVINFLGILQDKGRLIDFVMDDITIYDDQQVGAAARVIHQGLSSVMRECFEINPLSVESEGSAIELGEHFDAKTHRLIGKLGDPPHRGTVVHRGWQTSKVNLPQLTETPVVDTKILAPIQVETQV